jgi:quinol monooxygenase YgiN
MVKHLVFWKLKPEAGDRAKVVAQMKELLEALPPLIPALESLEVGVNANESEAAWDMALCTAFESWEDLQRYQEHPRHRKVVEFVRGVVSDRAVVDYEV